MKLGNVVSFRWPRKQLKVVAQLRLNVGHNFAWDGVSESRANWLRFSLERVLHSSVDKASIDLLDGIESGTWFLGIRHPGRRFNGFQARRA